MFIFCTNPCAIAAIVCIFRHHAVSTPYWGGENTLWIPCDSRAAAQQLMWQSTLPKDLLAGAVQCWQLNRQALGSQPKVTFYIAWPECCFHTRIID